MSWNRNSQAEGVPSCFDLSELRSLYGPADLHTLIVRALAELDDLRHAFDEHLAAQAYGHAAQALHRMKGTASFFRGAQGAIAALDDAERALKLSDAALLQSVLPRAQSILAALSEAMAAALVESDGVGHSEPTR